jgi:general secretion pathway protein I
MHLLRHGVVGRERGFTLLEVLVAFVIAAAALGVLFNTALSGVATVRNAALYQTALALAQSHLTLASQTVAAEGVSEGDDGPFRWRVRVSRVANAMNAPGAMNRVRQVGQMRATLYSVTATVGWRSEGHGREVHLETRRLGFEPTRGGGP